MNYREFFSAPRGVEEAIAFARAIREQEVSGRKDRRPPVSLLDHSAAPSYPEDTSDDVLSSSLSKSDDDSDKVRCILIRLNPDFAKSLYAGFG